MGSVSNNGPKVEYKADSPKPPEAKAPDAKPNETQSTDAKGTQSTPPGVTATVSTTKTADSKPTGGGTTPVVQSGPKSDTFTPSNNLFYGSLETEKPTVLRTQDSGSSPTGSVPTGSVPTGSVPTGSVPTGSVPTGSVPTGSVPTGSVPTGSVPTGSVPAGSVPAGSVPAGSTPHVLVIDNGQVPITKYGETHMGLVSETVKKYGPDVKITTYDLGKQISTGEQEIPAITATGSNGIDAWIADYSKVPGANIETLKEGLAKDPNAKVVNASFGTNRRDIYDNVYMSIINPDNKDSKALAEKLGIDEKTLAGVQKEYIEYYGGPTDTDGSLLKKLGTTEYSVATQKAIAAYVDKQLDAPNSEFQKNQKAYEAYTKELSEKGVTVVTSYGNSHEGGSWTYNQYKDGSKDQEVNFMAMSDYVISVAASDTNGPDGKPTDFSSRGGGRWKPTLSADGLDVAGVDGTVDGTSFSAPTVAGTVGEMLAKNPNLTFKDIKTNLTTNVYDTAASEYEEGAGILNYEKAIQSAGSAPTGSVPTGSVPTGSVPTGSVPTGSVPAGSVPTGSVPTGSVPTGSVPTGSVPTGSVPTGSVPTGSVPTGSVPTGSVPAGDVGSVPTGSVPTGSVPTGSVPTGSVPAGSTPVGSTPVGSSYATPEADRAAEKYFIENFNRISKGDGSVSGDDLLDMMNPNSGNVNDFTYSAYLAMGNPDLRNKLNAYDGNSSNGFTMNDLNAVYNSAGSVPVGSVPTGSVPTGSVPTGSVPTGSVPTGSVPTGSVPTGSVPTGSVPTGSVPTGSLPATDTGSVPAGSVPTGSVPTGSVPTGSVPTGSVPTGSVPTGSVPVGSVPVGSVPVGSVPTGSVPTGSTPTTYSLDQAFFDYGRNPNAAKDNNGKYLVTDFTGGYFSTTQGQADLGRIDALDGTTDGKISKEFVTGLADANSTLYKTYVEFDPTKSTAKANKDILTNKALFDKLDGDDTVIYGTEIDEALKSGNYTAEEKIQLQYLRNAKQTGGGTLWDAIAGGNTFSNTHGGEFDTKNRENLAKLDWDPSKVTMNAATTPTDVNSFYKALDTHKDASGNINYQTLLTDTTDPSLVGLRNFKVGDKSALDTLVDLDKAEHGGTARGFVSSESAKFIQTYGADGYNILKDGNMQVNDGNSKILVPLIPTSFTLPESAGGIYRPADITAAVDKLKTDPTTSLAERRALEYLSVGGDNSILKKWEAYVGEAGKGRTGTQQEWAAFLATLVPKT